MTTEQRENANKLEMIREELQNIGNLLLLVGYECSPYELELIDQVARMAHECQKLARM